MIWYYIIAVSIVSVAVCIHDKCAAKRGRRRVPEKTLFLLSGIGGAAAMYLCMQAIRHKTKHLSFMILLPMMIIAHIALIIFACKKLGFLF